MPNANDGGAQGGGDPRKKDYAIVVGVTRYPELTRQGRSADLKGSATDATKMREWLVSDSGGGVPPENVEYVVRAAAAPEATADPARDAVVRAFARMWKRCWRANGAPNVGMGRRLYVYVSGHGLTGDGDHGVLLCSNSSDSMYSTVSPRGSILAFRQSGFFRQFVVWFDGCMDWTSVEAEPINYIPPPGNDHTPPGPMFVAYAARPRLRTVEAQDRNGQVRGVFTRALLAGLEGEAACNGKVDARSLEEYLYNCMPRYLPAEALDDTIVDKQPYVPTVDRDIILNENATLPKSDIVFNIGAQYNGAQAQLWGGGAAGQGPTQLDARVIANGDVTFSLAKGIYIVVVPQHGLRQGFEVIGGVAAKVPEA